MSRALSFRLAKLEARHAPPALTRPVVVIPWRDWPNDDDAAGWEALRRAHPGPRLFVPSRLTPEEWEATVPTEQARS